MDKDRRRIDRHLHQSPSLKSRGNCRPIHPCRIASENVRTIVRVVSFSGLSTTIVSQSKSKTPTRPPGRATRTISASVRAASGTCISSRSAWQASKVPSG